MKLLSIAVPCYNSAAYMRKCIDSLLPGGEDVEIIIVNDGSSDSTPDIAEEYRERFPGIIKVVNKENGGHGSAVNAGIEHARGRANCFAILRSGVMRVSRRDCSVCQVHSRFT